MYTILALFFQRMRAPLIVLISAYSIAILGFTLVTGVDDQGQPWRMDFLQALYVVSYTGSTIGFGEIPYPFSSAQRLWTIASIYLTVIAWLFAIGSLIALLQDPAFRQALRQKHLERSIASINQAFYLICGYGDTGSALARNLVASGRRVVVVDRNPDTVQSLNLEDHGIAIPAFCSDAAIPASLIQAGLQSRWCAGLIAVTDSDRTNLKITLAGRLLNRNLTVAGRADESLTARNMKSFETGFVVQPDEEFARRLILALTRPESYRLYQRLTGADQTENDPEDDAPANDRAPTDGHWILCGDYSFARKLGGLLAEAGIPTRLIADSAPDRQSPDRVIEGHSAEAGPLRAAGVEQASGLIALHGDDSENLSTLLTARNLQPGLKVAARENHRYNRALYAQAGVFLDGSVSNLVISALHPILEAPLSAAFIELALEGDEAWARRCLRVIDQAIGEHPLAWWTGRISHNRAPAIAAAIEAGQAVTLDHLCLEPENRARRLACCPLMLRRDGRSLLLPATDSALQVGDVILFCGRQGVDRRMNAIASEPDILHYLLTGQHQPTGWLWQRFIQPRQDA